MISMAIRPESCRAFVDRLTDAYSTSLANVPQKWVISSRLCDKVEDSSFVPFYGYTSVYMLNDIEREKCLAVQNRIMSRHGNLFVQLPPATFHLTAHEFCNEYTVSAKASEIDAAEMSIEDKIRVMFHSINERWTGTEIRLRALGPSCGTDALSIKFVPEGTKDSNILQTIFAESEDIWPVGTQYTPHVSLGYFRTKLFSGEEIVSLYRDLNDIAASTDFTITLRTDDLVYQRHFDMQDFRKILSVGEA